MSKQYFLEFTKFQLSCSTPSDSFVAATKTPFPISLCLEGKMPRGRKVQQLRWSNYGTGVIYVAPLYGYGNNVAVRKEDWHRLLDSCPVVSSDLFPITITTEVECWARKSHRVLQEPTLPISNVYQIITPW